ncbi:MAG: hypothetical protein K940chlam3_00112 [Chlamydiae bacterium]|nr:hypothetical protein [Chlamydiota bacterium]
MEWTKVKDQLPDEDKELEFRFKDPYGGGTGVGHYAGYQKSSFLFDDNKPHHVFRGTNGNVTITTMHAFEWRYV